MRTSAAPNQASELDRQSSLMLHGPAMMTQRFGPGYTYDFTKTFSFKNTDDDLPAQQQSFRYLRTAFKPITTTLKKFPPLNLINPLGWHIASKRN